ncbi:MAG: EutN/CcmL family microcompartment protein [Desulfobacterales bacterium]|nr:EutN/CcmL family microcompartment protein [Desulfobacterales bacterium]
MIIGRVVGNVWATRKEEGLNGLKLMIVAPMDPVMSGEMASLVAVDQVGAGIGDNVLVTRGSAARKAVADPHAPVDAAIVGIIDEMEVRKDEE